MPEHRPDATQETPQEVKQRQGEHMLARLQSFHRTLDIDFWRKRLKQAEDALIREWQMGRCGTPEVRSTNRPCPADDPPPIREELQMWRGWIDSAFHATCRLNQALASNQIWVNQWPEVLQYSRTIRQRAYSILEYIDQLLLELEMETAVRKWREWWDTLTPEQQREVERHRGGARTESPTEDSRDTQEYCDRPGDAGAQGKYQGDARRYPRTNPTNHGRERHSAVTDSKFERRDTT